MRRYGVLFISLFISSCLFLGGHQILALNSIGLNGAQAPDISVPTLPGPTIPHLLATRTAQAWPWYVTRGAGIVAAVLLLLLILSGIGLITGYTFRVFEPLNAWAVHKAIALAFGVAIIVHGGSLLFDKYVHFSLIQVFVPFASTYKPVVLFNHHIGSLWVALGVMSSYLFAIVIGTSLWLIDRKPRYWKLIHFLSYLAAVMVYFHILYTGTDTSHGFYRVLWLILGYILAFGILFRLKRARSI